MGLVCLLTINGMADAMGVLLVCLHVEQPIPEVNLSEDCCHEASLPEAPACRDCTDIQLRGTDVMATRVSEPLLSPLVAVCGSFTFEFPAKTGSAPGGPHPVRGPPAIADICLLVARTVVLRV